MVTSLHLRSTRRPPCIFSSCVKTGGGFVVQHLVSMEPRSTHHHRGRSIWSSPRSKNCLIWLSLLQHTRRSTPKPIFWKFRRRSAQNFTPDECVCRFQEDGGRMRRSTHGARRKRRTGSAGSVRIGFGGGLGCPDRVGDQSGLAVSVLFFSCLLFILLI